ncbi:MAG TPA: hypothetical protein VES93_15035 [Ornithinibacter sp.]|nr:hypothetical protein [Ornithinibacter sp.]
MTGVLRLSDPQSLADLGRFATRARAVDAEGAMRLQASGAVLAAWVGVLAGVGILAEGTVLGLRTFALAEPAELDVTVPLGAVTDRTARGLGADLPVPPTRAVASWSAVTPPRGPWEPAGALPGDLLAAVARDGLAEVSDAVRERGAAAGLVRDRVWARDVRDAAGPHPDLLDAGAGLSESSAVVRAGGAFAAYALGFLAPGLAVQVFRSNRWTRLTAPGGHVLIR